MTIPEFNDIIEQNDQTAARREHLEKLRELIGNCYPNKFDRSAISGPKTRSRAFSVWPDHGCAAQIKEVSRLSPSANGRRPR
jgi:hypothetical protein